MELPRRDPGATPREAFRITTTELPDTTPELPRQEEGPVPQSAFHEGRVGKVSLPELVASQKIFRAGGRSTLETGHPSDAIEGGAIRNEDEIVEARRVLKSRDSSPATTLPERPWSARPRRSDEHPGSIAPHLEGRREPWAKAAQTKVLPKIHDDRPTVEIPAVRGQENTAQSARNIARHRRPGILSKLRKIIRHGARTNSR
jgi:hypothetical protein